MIHGGRVDRKLLLYVVLFIILLSISINHVPRDVLATIFYWIVLPIIFIATILVLIPRKK